MERKEIPAGESEKRVQKANLAFPDALVNNYEGLIELIELPDEKDRHVVSAAIKTNAHIIVSNNIKDFPDTILQKFGLKIKTADDFITDIIDLNPATAIDAFREMVLCKKNPAIDEYQVLDQLRKVGLTETANYLHALL